MELVRSEVVGTPGFFRVENRWYRDSQGAEHLRQVVLHLGAVAVVPFDGQRVWLIRQTRVAVGRRILEIPAGKLDVAGEDHEAAARRECVEEIGKRPGRVWQVASFYNSPGFTDEYTHVFLADQLADVDRDPKGAEEVTAEVVSLSVAEVRQMMDASGFDDAKTIIGLRALLAHLDGEGEGAGG